MNRISYQYTNVYKQIFLLLYMFYLLLCATVIAEIVISHIPLMTWPHRERGAYNFFGHIHSGPVTAAEVDQDLPLWQGLQYDVGVDNNDYTPIEFNEILEKLK